MGLAILPDSLGSQLAEIERRLRTLETSNPLSSASIDHGAMRVLDTSVDPAGLQRVVVGQQADDTFGIWIYDETGTKVILKLGTAGLAMHDADGDLRARLGLIDEPNNRYGILVLDADGVTARLQADERGLLTPYLAAPFVAATGDFLPVTSATFVATHLAQIEQITHEGLYCWVTATSDAATTGEMRLRNVSTGAVTDAVSIPAGSGGTQYQFRWLHGSALSFGPAGFEVQARRTGGAGDVNIYRPPGVWMTDPGLCVADGVA